MSDLEFDLLDELYFIQSYDQIKDTLQWEEELIRDTLIQLYQKGWLKCFSDPNQEVQPDEIDLQTRYRWYYYLASKKGLFAHNSTRQHE